MHAALWLSMSLVLLPARLLAQDAPDAGGRPTPHRIVAVTVYQGNALITREVSVPEGPGTMGAGRHSATDRDGRELPLRRGLRRTTHPQYAVPQPGDQRGRGARSQSSTHSTSNFCKRFSDSRQTLRRPK